MSLLWPETISAGLFPNQCWIRRGASTFDSAAPAGLDSGTWLEKLETLLDEQSNKVRKRSGLQLVVSDSLCRLAVLPWQSEVRAEAEVRAYAQACFAGQGSMIEAGWVMQAGFRHFQAAGLAYAIPEAWLLRLLELTQRRGLRLRSVMPASAAAYWQLSSRDQAPYLLMLAEERRVTGQIYQRGRFIAMDVQPIMGDFAGASTRLIQRIASAYQAVDRVLLWSPESLQQSFAPSLGKALPEVPVQHLKKHVWTCG